MLDSRSCFLLFSATLCLSILRAFVVQTLPRVRVRRQRFFFLLCVSLLLPLLYSVSCLLTGCQRRINQTLKKLVAIIDQRSKLSNCVHTYPYRAKQVPITNKRKISSYAFSFRKFSEKLHQTMHTY
jgi:predicted PurR-regulated permease PerM